MRRIGKKPTGKLRIFRGYRRGHRHACVASAGVWLLCVLLLLALAGCSLGATTRTDTTAGSTASVNVTPTQTPTPVSDFVEVAQYLFNDLSAVPFRGNLLIARVDVHANTFLINIAPAGSDLGTIQWNAYQAQKTIWRASRYRITPGWTVSVRQYINGDDYTGTLVGSADLHEPHGYALDWAHLSPEQAWAKYDSATYHGG